MDRAARAAACNLRPFWARVVSVEGAVRWVIVTGCALGVCASAAAIYGDLTGGADAAIGDFGAFARAALLWFGLNVALCLGLGLADWAPFRADPRAPRFERYPLFSWLTPGAQQVIFFLPAAAYLGWAAAAAAAGRPRGGGRPFERSLALHCIPSVAGMQFRELLLFESDAAMRAHHAATIALVALSWYGLRARPGDDAWVLAAAASTAAMEAGSFGCVLWTVTGGGTPLAKVAYALVLVSAHAQVLVAGVAGVLYRRPDARAFWLVFGAALPLVYARHAYMVAELRAGSASGSFDDVVDAAPAGRKRR